MEQRQGSGWTCSKCLKTFDTKANLKYHMFSHDVFAKVKCEVCGKVLKNPVILSQHIKLHDTKRDRPSCDICQRIFSTPANLRTHIRTVHNRTKRPRFPFEFPDCDKSYLSKGDVLKHIKSEHSENPTRFPCTLCGKEFKLTTNLERHISSHTTEKAFVCSTCGRSFAHSITLKRHKATNSEKSTRWTVKCELCNHVSLRRAHLQSHIQAVHENQRNYPCTFCDQRFSTLVIMRRHVEARHTGNSERIHSCDKCKFLSHSKISLYQHARRHNLVKRQKCCFCKKQFFYFWELVIHCRRHTLEQ
ncbi:gastrula zinc finger protein XlCGF8.2DB [Folsomia candida]|uniref:Zinc finger protein 26 n=1 Tax=Folsomia candida TaxID=158441 RepID=A0A226DSL0_FOLCA|nr:gastrula zinc finger protein XlCGF8.2DB [Folsomia candida]OXA47681.1 Zinc finger protein 26 [Folsomia candida]